MSVVTTQPAGGAYTGVAASPPLHSPPPAPGEACPLCGAPLHPEQEWCVRCGAAARTRLAAAPNWKKPVAVLAAVVALSLGVIAAALVALAGSSTTAAPATTVVTSLTSPAATTTPAPTSTTPTSTFPSATTPQAGTPTGPATTSTTGAGGLPAGKPDATLPAKAPLPGKPPAKAPRLATEHIKLTPKAEAEIKRAVAKGLREHRVGKVQSGTATK